jgi:hypothetical protein
MLELGGVKPVYQKCDQLLQSGVPITTAPQPALSGLPRIVEATLPPTHFQSLALLMNRDSRRRQPPAAMYGEEHK